MVASIDPGAHHAGVTASPGSMDARTRVPRLPAQLFVLEAELFVLPGELRADAAVHGVQIELIPTGAGRNLGEVRVSLLVGETHPIGRLPLPGQTSGPGLVEMDPALREPGS